MTCPYLVRAPGKMEDSIGMRLAHLLTTGSEGAWNSQGEFMMRSSSLRRTENMRRLTGALVQRSMGYREVAALLGISESAARNYLRELELAGVAAADAVRRTEFRLHPDPAVLEGFLSTLVQPAEQQRVSLRRSTTRHCTDPGKEFLHVLADDVRFPLVRHPHRACRDPLVAALFGMPEVQHATGASGRAGP